MKTITINKLPSLTYEVGEALNTFCTNLTFSGDKTRVIMFTSCLAHEGKSFTALNTMVTLAKLGYAVALVDGDLRRSVMGTEYGFSKYGSGLSHYLAGKAKMEDVIYQTNYPNAYMVPAGVAVRNPLPLLNSPRLKQLMTYLSGQLDYILVDTPPVGTVIDAAQVAKSCDGIVLVVKYNAVSRKALQESQNQLQQSGCPILGTVLSMVDYDSFLNKKYYYRSYYKSYYKSYRKPYYAGDAPAESLTQGSRKEQSGKQTGKR